MAHRPTKAGTTKPFRILYSGCSEAKREIVEKLARSNAIFSVHGFLVDDCSDLHSSGSTYTRLHFRAYDSKSPTRFFEKPDLAISFHDPKDTETADNVSEPKKTSWQDSALLRELGIPVLDIVDADFRVEAAQKGAVVVDIESFLSTPDEQLCDIVEKIMKPYFERALKAWEECTDQQAAYTSPWWRVEVVENATPPVYDGPSVTFGLSREHTEDDEEFVEEDLPPYETDEAYDPEKGIRDGAKRRYVLGPPLVLQVVGLVPNKRSEFGMRARAFFGVYAVLMLMYSTYILSIHLPALLHG